MALEQVELLGTEVVPVLRREMEARRAPGAADAPTHASLVKARFGDGPTAQARPNANRGDNLTGASPVPGHRPGVSPPSTRWSRDDPHRRRATPPALVRSARGAWS